MDRFLNIKYKLEQSDRLDEFLAAIGVNIIVRTIANRLTPTIELKKDDDEYTLITKSTFKIIHMKFKIGEEFEDERPTGEKVKSVCTVDGNVLTQTQKGLTKDSVIVREFSDQELKMIMKVDDIVCTRIHKAT